MLQLARLVDYNQWVSSASDITGLLTRAAGGNREAVGDLLAIFRPRLRRMVAVRLDPRVRGRVDESDVVQEACLEASRRIAEYFADQSVPIFVWLRFLTAQQLTTLHRLHLGAQARDAKREVSVLGQGIPSASSEFLAGQLVGPGSSPSETVQKKELKVLVQGALERMDSADRDILAMRHYEQMTNSEIAHALGMNASTASTRYVRALRRLKKELGDLSPWLPALK